MKRNAIVTMVVFAACVAAVQSVSAFPTQAEIKAATDVVGDLVADDIRNANAGKLKREDVAGKLVGLVDRAESDAAKWVLYKHAFIQYAKAYDFEKAGEVLSDMVSLFSDVPPQTVIALIDKNCGKANAKNAPVVVKMRKLMFMRQKCGGIVANAKASKKEKAEACCLMGDWAKGLKMFADIGGKTAEMAAAETSGSQPKHVVANYWWDYKSDLDTCDQFKAHAAEIYKAGLEDDSISGLYKDIAEKRIAEMEAVPVVATCAATATYARNPYVTRGLVAMWDGEWNVGLNRHDDKTLVWKNLGSLGKAYDATRPDACWQKNSAEFHRGGSCFTTPNELMSKHMKDEWTVEVVYKPTSRHKEYCSGVAGDHRDGSVGLVLGQSSNPRSGIIDWGLYDSRVNFWSMPASMADKNETFFVTLAGSVSSRTGLAYLNGNRINKIELSAKAGTLTCPNEFYIGRCNHGGGVRTFDGQIYCLRIYNRPLKESEVKANNDIDKKRFGEMEAMPTVEAAPNAAKVKGLIHRWSFNNNLKDSVGKSHGKAEGSITYKNNAVVLPGGNQKTAGAVNLGNNLLSGGKDFTIELWATLNRNSSWAAVFRLAFENETVRNGRRCGENQFRLGWNTDWHLSRPEFVAPFFIDDLKMEFVLNEPYHIVVIGKHGGNGTCTYICMDAKAADPELIIRINRVGEPLLKQTRELWLGRSSAAWNDDPAATYDEVRIWNRALTQEELNKSHKCGPNKLF